MRAREDGCGGLVPQIVDGNARVLALGQLVRTRLYKGTDERAVLVERRSSHRGVRFECEGEIGTVVQLVEQRAEGAEAEAAKRRVEVRSAHGHVFRLLRGPVLSFPALGPGAEHPRSRQVRGQDALPA